MAASKDDPLAKEQLKKFSDLEAWRKANRDDDWQTISQYCLPQDSNITTQKTESVSGWTDQIFDTTAIHAMEILSAGLFNWWTPPNQPWGEFAAPKRLKLEAGGSADKFLGEAGDSWMEELARSNFYSAKATGDLGLAVFATDLIIADESDTGNELFNFIHCQIGTYVIEENYRGVVDTIRREVEMTYRQICQKFSMDGDNIPEKMKEMAKGAKGGDRKFKIIHCIFPREDSQKLPGRKDGKGMPIASVWIAKEFIETIRVSGYHESPILCRRFKKWVSPYGYGPGFLCLPDCRQVNYVQQYLDALAELHAYPRVLIPDNLEGDVDLRAGGPTVWDTSNPEGKPSEWMTVGDYKLGIEMQEQRRQAIRDACFVDAFKLLNSAPLLDKKMTAFEIAQRQSEQLQNMTPVDSRHIQEFHNPLGKRMFGGMFRAGRLGQAPQELTQTIRDGVSGLVQPEIVATSRFQTELKALKNRGIVQTFETIIPLSQSQPELGIFDNFVIDDAVVELAQTNGVSPDLIRERKKSKVPTVEQLREQRAKIAQQQRAAEAAEQLGKAGAGLGKSPEFMQQAAKDAMGGKKKAA